MILDWAGFKNRLSECVAKAGSQANLSRLACVHKNTVYKILSAENPIDVSDAVIKKIAEGVGYKAYWLKTGNGTKENVFHEGLYSEEELETAIAELSKLELELGIEISRKNLAATLSAILGIIRESEDAGVPVSYNTLRNVIKLAA